MEFYLRSSILSTVLLLSSAQYHAQYPQNYESSGPSIRPAAPSPVHLNYPDSSAQQSYHKHSTPRPLILSHKQTQTHDGGFRYAFTADNGLQQGEQINPDGTRTGAYSYVDPHGQQITIKYTAGKEGFRIIEGPHKTPDVAPHQEPSQSATNTYSGPQTFAAQNDGSRYTHAFHRGPSLESVTTAQPLVVNYQPYKNSGESSSDRNDIQNEPEYHDEPGKPYSFGTGYSFEFSG